MLHHFKVRYAIYAFLLICVLSTNHIIIYNEELLVALSFFLFVVFVARYFGNNIKESLDSSSEAIREICENLTNSKQQYLRQLSKELEKSVKYKSLFSALKKAHLEQLSNKTALTQSIHDYFHQQWLQKSATLVESKLHLQPLLLDLMAKNQLDLVLTKWVQKGTTQGKLDPKLLDSVIKVMAK